MKQTVVLAVDAAINIVLRVLLIAFPRPLVDALGVPASQSPDEIQWLLDATARMLPRSHSNGTADTVWVS